MVEQAVPLSVSWHQCYYILQKSWELVATYDIDIIIYWQDLLTLGQGQQMKRNLSELRRRRQDRPSSDILHSHPQQHTSPIENGGDFTRELATSQAEAGDLLPAGNCVCVP